jgi:RNA polymerase sigma-70 factor (ECF subfamily)
MITPPSDQLAGTLANRATGDEGDGWTETSLFEDPASLIDHGESLEPGAATACPPLGALLGLPSALTEDQLAAWIAAIANRDERALCALYDATLARVYGLALRIVRKASLAEEVAEDTYFQVWRQALRFDPARGSPMAWLLGMARSRAIDTLRREARFQHQSLDLGSAAEVADDKPGSDDLLAVAQGHAELQRALLLLHAQPRQLVALAFFRGLSHEEIASQTELPLGTVKSQIRRALLVLRQALGETGLPSLAS